MLAVVAVVFLFAAGFWIWALYDALTQPRDAWVTVRQPRALWLWALVLLGLPAALGYAAIARPALERTRFAVRPGTVFDPTAFGVPEGGIRFGDGGFHQ